MRKKEIGLINNYLFLPYYQTIIYLISWIENQSLIINSLGDKIIIPPKDIYSFDSWGFLVPPSQIYLLINDNRPIITLYSTGKCDVGAHLSFIGRYMCEWISKKKNSRRIIQK